MVVVDVSILWLFLASALVVLMQAQALRLAKTNRELAASEHALRVRERPRVPGQRSRRRHHGIGAAVVTVGQRGAALRLPQLS